MITQVVDVIKEQLMKTTETVQSKRFRPPVDKTKDIEMMVQCIRKNGHVKDTEWQSFKKLKEPLSCINADKLHLYMNGSTVKKVLQICIYEW